MYFTFLSVCTFFFFFLFVLSDVHSSRFYHKMTCITSWPPNNPNFPAFTKRTSYTTPDIVFQLSIIIYCSNPRFFFFFFLFDVAIQDMCFWFLWDIICLICWCQQFTIIVNTLSFIVSRIQLLSKTGYSVTSLKYVNENFLYSTVFFNFLACIKSLKK
jgi:hypothetical protein